MRLCWWPYSYISPGAKLCFINASKQSKFNMLIDVSNVIVFVLNRRFPCAHCVPLKALLPTTCRGVCLGITPLNMYVPFKYLKVDCTDNVVKFVTVISSRSVAVDSASFGRSVAAVETNLPGGCLPPRSRLGVGACNSTRHTNSALCSTTTDMGFGRMLWNCGYSREVRNSNLNLDHRQERARGRYKRVLLR
jgi:hypothetical protein